MTKIEKAKSAVIGVHTHIFERDISALTLAALRRIEYLEDHWNEPGSPSARDWNKALAVFNGEER